MDHGRHLCAATASFGLESLVRDELTGLGIAVTRTEDRRVIFEAGPNEVARANLCLRTADRVLLVVGSFDAPDFGALFEGVRALPWRSLLASSPRLTVNARTQKSKLTAVPSLQAVTQKAIMEAMRGGPPAHGSRSVPAGGAAPAYDVEVALASDRATLFLDTTGPGLHKRGYRRGTGPAPLRETLAAALVMLSRWEPGRPFADPLCGSGTIPIEAALIGTRRAPGLGRAFAAEAWDLAPAAAWTEERERARSAIRSDAAPLITGSDRDPAVVRLAQQNARAAGVEEHARFHAAALADFAPTADYGCLVCNPPYGERLGDPRAARVLYAEMGALYRRLPTWSFFALTADQEFPRAFGARDSRNRKLYNGNIRCWLYQYFGPLPR
jgi:putative N6-adenine-specific DNA methylase